MKKTKILSIIIAFMLAFSITACGKSNGTSQGGGTTKPPKATGTINDMPQHYYKGGLHKFNMGTTNIVYAENGTSEYKVVISENATLSDKNGAAYIRRFTLEAMGADIPLITEKEVTYTENEKLIVFNCPTLFASAGLTMTEDNIGQNGYYIKSAGKSVFVMSKDQILGYGARNAGLEIMRQLIGLEFFTGDTYSYNCKVGDKIMLPSFDITEAPDIEWMQRTNNPSTTTTMGLRGTTAEDLFMNPIGGGTWHNTLRWLPIAEANAEQKEHWYNSDKTELCYTAHGNQAMLDEMIRRCVEKAIASVEAKPNKKVITFTVMDGGHYCSCPSCTDSKKAYGGADSAAHIKFVNRIGKGLDEYLTAKAEREGTEKRDITLLFFAYNQTVNPPVREVNGKLEPWDDSVVVYPNVGVYFAPIGMQFNESFYSDVNSSFKLMVEGWNVLTDKIYLWFYGTNFFEYLYPFNSWSALPESYRFLAENDTKYIFNQAQYNQGQGGVTGFGTFKEYLHHQLRWDSNQNYLDLTNRFFKGYFKQAEEPMRRYFDELTAHLEYLEDTYSTQINGSIYHHPTSVEHYPLRTLKQWMGYINEALSLIESVKSENITTYNTLYNNILMESIFLRYAMLTIHEGTFSADELMAERISFKNDCNMLGIVRFVEGSLLSTLYEQWGI